jgi:hypothetical protein
VNPSINRLKWTREDEEKLLSSVAEYGSSAWVRVSRELGNRSDVQCRFRYQYLSKKAEERGRPIGPIMPCARVRSPPEVPLEESEGMEESE